MRNEYIHTYTHSYEYLNNKTKKETFEKKRLLKSKRKFTHCKNDISSSYDY